MQDILETQTRIPPRLSPAFARGLSLCLTGHARETGLVRYLALALLYASWHFDGRATLAEYCAALKEMPDDEGEFLLENLAHAPAYGRRGHLFGMPTPLIRAAQTAAVTWKEQLLRPGMNVLRLQQRASALLEYVIRLQETVQMDSEHPALLEQLDYLVDAFEYSESMGPSEGLVPGQPILDVFQFDSAVSALEYIIAKSRANQEALAPVVQAAEAAAHLRFRSVQVYDPMEAFNALKRLPPPPNPEGNGQQRLLLERLTQGSGDRLLAEVPDGDPLAALYERFPHFSQPLDFIAGALALAACGDEGSPVLVPPMLLRGPPGTGKTYFAQELAKALEVAFVSRDLSVASEAFVLSGLDPSWKNSKQGLVFDTLTQGTSANPLICLDEVDKCREGGTHSSPLASLYALLEPASSKAFMDEFVTIPLDARRISWVLTANDGPVPEPLLSRLEVFDIAPPSPAQCLAIAHSVWQDLTTQQLPHGHGFPATLSNDLLGHISTLTPRLMRKALTHALSAAVLHGRKGLVGSDVDQGVARYAGSQAHRSIGFQASF